MKNYFIALLAVMLFGCGSSPKTPSAAGDNAANNIDTVTAHTTPGQIATSADSGVQQASFKKDSKTVAGHSGNAGTTPTGKSETNSTAVTPASELTDAGTTTKPVTSAKTNDDGNEISLSPSPDNTVTGSYFDDGNTIIYVGVFAKWNNDGSQFDGSYDSTHSLFVLCGSNRCQHVPASDIAYQIFGSCDTAREDRIKMFKINKNGSLNPDGARISVKGNRGFIKEGNSIRTIELSPATIKRINKANTWQKAGALQLTPPVKKAEVLATKPVDAAVSDNTKTKMVEEKKDITKKLSTEAKLPTQPSAKEAVKFNAENKLPPTQPATKVLQQPALRKMAADTPKQANKTKLLRPNKVITPQK